MTYVCGRLYRQYNVPNITTKKSRPIGDSIKQANIVYGTISIMKIF